MSPLAFYRDLIAKGVPEAAAYEIAAKFEADKDAEVQARMAELLDRLSVDVKAEARRAKDRERKAASKPAKAAEPEAGIPRNSAESAEIVEFRSEPLSLPPSPQTPQPPTHTRVSINTRGESAREQAGFDRFWAEYPRKTAKADARKAFTKAWAKLPPHDEEAVLIGGLERAKAAWSDAQFIPHPATWLNGERWNDEPPPPSQPRQAHDRPHQNQRQASPREDRLSRMLRGAMAAVDERDPGLG